MRPLALHQGGESAKPVGAALVRTNQRLCNRSLGARILGGPCFTDRPSRAALDWGARFELIGYRSTSGRRSCRVFLVVGKRPPPPPPSPPRHDLGDCCAGRRVPAAGGEKG